MPGKEDLCRGRGTLDGGYPWLPYGAVIELENILKPEFNVLEFGSGGSTIFLANRCARVTSLETDPVWAETMKDFIPSNVGIMTGSPDWLITVAQVFSDELFDLVLIDSGSYKWIDPMGVRQKQNPNRRLQAYVVTPKIKKGGYLVINNYTRFGMKDYDYSCFDVYTFDFIGKVWMGRGTKICIKL
jgi:hypothetical protein